ncbi:gluconate 5-dehydrogenase [Aureobasidium namibiae CBS 147.97]|uniref:Gluconate 5-dehydrogenase n=1 Tax=Aureobasidium namibiae CBS 147.97 TaxID=1043004 RepID=A0A074WE01_9PEZI|nr:gluconate 5-dehydrogenase [Aureobasidium namibiae CBS 147.97]KEQ69794.1 gluconate 5-dehydrogenase [Aureobasidium namibiae CBS 147.97]
MDNGACGRLHNKVAVVTGSSSGIGRAIALRFSSEGAHVVCADTEPTADSDSDSGGDDATHDVILKSGCNALFVATNVGCSREVEDLVRATVSHYGRLDIFVNNAGITFDLETLQPIWSADEELWDDIQQVNSKGVFLGCKYASRQMLSQEPHPNGDRGWIVNVASIFGMVGTSNFASYCASKGAIVNMTKAVALDCAPHRIHVNCICPGCKHAGTSSQMTSEVLRDEETQEHIISLHPFRGLGIPDDIARAVVFLASEDSSWITGVALPVDGGYTAR